MALTTSDGTPAGTVRLSRPVPFPGPHHGVPRLGRVPAARRTLIPTSTRALLAGVLGAFALATASASAAPVAGLPADAVADYQLGGAYAPPSGVTVVVRDSTER